MAVNAESADQYEEIMPIGSDPLYIEALDLTQQGHWRQASEALVTLERRYPDNPELRHARQLLALHLSAEQTWLAGLGSRFRFYLQAPTIRLLLLANLLLYLLLAALLLAVGSSSLAF